MHINHLTRTSVQKYLTHFTVTLMYSRVCWQAVTSQLWHHKVCILKSIFLLNIQLHAACSEMLQYAVVSSVSRPSALCISKQTLWREGSYWCQAEQQISNKSLLCFAKTKETVYVYDSCYFCLLYAYPYIHCKYSQCLPSFWENFFQLDWTS